MRLAWAGRCSRWSAANGFAGPTHPEGGEIPVPAREALQLLPAAAVRPRMGGMRVSASNEAGRPAFRRPRLSRKPALVLATTAALLLVAAATAWPFIGADAYLPDPAVPSWVLALAFAATEISVLTVQVKREGRSVSLSELPVVAGLFFASPLVLIAARFAGSAVAMVQRRAPLLKATFNLVLFTTETTVALAIFRLVAPADPGGPSPATWLAAYAGTLVATTCGGAVLGLVISIYEGGLRPLRMLRDALSVQQTAPMVVTIALVTVTSLAASAASAWLLSAFGALLVLAYRAYASLAGRHLNLERIYRFSQAVSSSPEIDGVLANVLAEAKELLRSERASVTFVSESGQVARVRMGADGGLSRTEESTADEDAWLFRRVVEDGESQLLPRGSRDPATRRLLERH